MSYSQKNSLGTEYFLNQKDVVLKNGGKSIARYFSKDHRPATAIDAVPSGLIVIENPHSHILLLKKAK